MTRRIVHILTWRREGKLGRTTTKSSGRGILLGGEGGEGRFFLQYYATFGSDDSTTNYIKKWAPLAALCTCLRKSDRIGPMRFAWKNFFFGMLLGGLTLGGWVALWGRQEATVLSATIELTPTPTLTLQPTLSASGPASPKSSSLAPTPKPIPTLPPTEPSSGPVSAQASSLALTPTPPPASSQEINEFIERYAGQYSVDPNALRYIAVCESGFNPNAVNGPYAGLYQFASSTWSNNRNIMAEDPNPSLRTNAEESIQTAAYLLSTKGAGFWPNCQPKS